MKMNRAQKKHMHKEVVRMLQVYIEDCGPQWEEPIVFLSSKKFGLFVSLTKEDEHSVILPWKKFEQFTIESDIELIEKYLPRFKSLVRKMENTVKLSEK